ncbi:hypothetical protein ONZ45_g10935 [Pleurotus djamor]|nr:hypothetical protein ONZ45_g10935 [Pleurotus djamor]
MSGPSSFKSAYRLLLRACSASVLHHRGATRNLRKLYRPTFDEAVEVIKEIQTNPPPHRQQKLEEWLNHWNKTIDNTLLMLYNSSISRGIPHQVTRNLALLALGQRQRLTSQSYKRWVPPSRQQPPPKQSKEKKRVQWESMDENAWSALSHTIKMAEGRQGLCLGKVTVKGKIFPRD